VRFEPTSLFTARWVTTDSATQLRRFAQENEAAMAVDHTGAPVFLARNAWHLERTQKDWPEIRFLRPWSSARRESRARRRLRPAAGAWLGSTIRLVR